MFYRRIRAEKTGYNSPPRTRAVALGYDAEHDQAPRVLASGQGVIAEQIIAVAREKGIAVREDPILLAALSGLDVGELIPPELYAVVAEVLAYVYNVKERREAGTR